MSTRSRGRIRRHHNQPAVRYRAVVSALRQEILAGTLVTGQRLPTQAELQARFQTTPVTIHRAIQELARAGLVRTQPRVGVFVADRPPGVDEYPLVFFTTPDSPAGLFWSRFNAMLVNEATQLTEQGPRKLIPFYGIQERDQSPDYAPLLERVQNQRLAGLIFACHPFHVMGTPILDRPGIPRVALLFNGELPGVAGVALDFAGLFRRALDRLAARGRRRVAFLGVGIPRVLLPVNLEAELAARGLTMHPYWKLFLSPDAPSSTSSVIQLLWQAPPDARPDALFISDDNLLQDATDGLLTAGIRVGDELDVVAHCNFPWLGSTVLPIQRIGFDTRQLLQTGLALLDRQRRGEPVPPVTMLEALFEHELASQTLAQGMQTQQSQLLVRPKGHRP